MTKLSLTFLCLLTLSACHNAPVWQYNMFKQPNGKGNYPPIYVKGWQDGCESGAEASATHFYRAFYQFKQDWSLLNDPYYVRGWENAYNHCRKYILQHNLENL